MKYGCLLKDVGSLFYDMKKPCAILIVWRKACIVVLVGLY